MIKGIHQMKNLISIAVSLILIAGCTNINSTGVVGTSSGQVVVANTTNATQTLTQFAYVATSGSTTELTLSLSANTAASGYQPFTNYCAVGNTTNLQCYCQMSWTEIDTVNGTSYNYDRTKKLALSEVQSGLVQCQLD
jgi:hypothetical protein